MTAYLVAHPPIRSQFRSPRRSRPTGLTVMHTAESPLDWVTPDTGAENVAAWMTRRTDPGSYHDLVDSDSVIQLVRYEDEAYQDGTGSNPYALSISFALRATDWPSLTPARRAAFLTNGATAFARQQTWLRDHGYPTTPLRRINRGESAGGVAGFIAHADRDPTRRTDPGPDFPWAEWFQACADATPGEDFVMDAQTKQEMAQLLRENIGDQAPPDGWFWSEVREQVAAVVQAEVLKIVRLENVSGAADLGRLLGALVPALTAALGDQHVQVTPEQVRAALDGAVVQLNTKES